MSTRFKKLATGALPETGFVRQAQLIPAIQLKASHHRYLVLFLSPISRRSCTLGIRKKSLRALR